VALGEHATQGDECAGTATMIVPGGALAGQPGQQPRLELMLTGEADVVASNRIVRHQWLPQGLLPGKAGGDLDKVIGLLFFLGMELPSTQQR
jgi:hypothetical protein